jgi:hypothetical protein
LKHTGIMRKFDPKRDVSVATLSYEYPAGFRVPERTGRIS